VNVGVAVGVEDGVAVTVGVEDGVAVTVGVGVPVGEGIGIAVGVGVRVGAMVGIGVGKGVRVGVGTFDSCAAVCVGASSRVGDEVEPVSPQAITRSIATAERNAQNGRVRWLQTDLMGAPWWRVGSALATDNSHTDAVRSVVSTFRRPLSAVSRILPLAANWGQL